jgi:hypothetical protein
VEIRRWPWYLKDFEKAKGMPYRTANGRFDKMNVTRPNGLGLCNESTSVGSRWYSEGV